MTLNPKVSLWLLLFISTICVGQADRYSYQRSLGGIEDIWHTISLPNDIFQRLSTNLSDLRIIGVSQANDTIEAPYILQKTSETIAQKNIPFKLINQSNNSSGYFYTFEIPSEATINQILLNFEKHNFDWQLTIEGSANQSKWFILAENYRIISIKNDLTDYSFTRLKFADAKFRYFRLQIKTKTNPQLSTAALKFKETKKAVYRTYDIKSFSISEDKEKQTSILEIDLPYTVPVSYLKFDVSDTVDYYRNITVNYVRDSVETEKGWRYSYSLLDRGVLSSLEENELTTASTVLKKLRIIIQNNDNVPLKIVGVSVHGYEHKLVARFTEPAQYYLRYGKEFDAKPNYDVSRFKENIPKNSAALQLGKEEYINSDSNVKRNPLFQSEYWLWGIMILVIIILGWFSFRMIAKKSE